MVWRAGCGVCFVLWLTLASTVNAQERRALWIAGELPSDAERSLARSVSASLDVELVTPEEARDRLHELVGDAPPDPGVTRAEEALREAREAYVELRLQRAHDAHDEALEALMSIDSRVVTPQEVSQIYLSRALVSLAGGNRQEAEEALADALTVDPEFEVDPTTYGEMLLTAYRAAQGQARARDPIELRIDRAPADAVVHVDGREVPEGQSIQVSGLGPHLVSAQRPGFVPSSLLAEADRANPRVAVVLRRAEGDRLARDALASWRDGDDLAPHAASMVAQAIGASRIVRAHIEGGEVHVLLREPGDVEPIRTAHGRLDDVEGSAYVLSEALAGRTVRTVPEPSASLSAPSTVAPGASIPLRISLRDPASRVAAVQARCGQASERRTVEARGEGRGEVTISLEAPDDEGTAHCRIELLDIEQAALATLPERGPLAVEVVEPGSGGATWLAWLGGGVLVAAGAAALVYFLLPRDQELVFDVME